MPPKVSLLSKKNNIIIQYYFFFIFFIFFIFLFFIFYTDNELDRIVTFLGTDTYFLNLLRRLDDK